jgi:hypothetical protein
MRPTCCICVSGSAKAIARLTETLQTRIGDERMEELRGIEQHSGLPWECVLLLHLSYESKQLCTAIMVHQLLLFSLICCMYRLRSVCGSTHKAPSCMCRVRVLFAQVHDDDGHPWLARTLDWPMPMLRRMTIQVRFLRDRRVLYHATTFVGYTGVLTAMRPGGFAVAVNYRLPIYSDDPSRLTALTGKQSTGMTTNKYILFSRCVASRLFVANRR